MAVVVRSDANVTLTGTGYISGTSSLNKTGQGTLTIQSDQHYTGPTVLHKGTYEFASLKNGEQPSGLGMSQEFAQNWVMAGGTYKYTGATTATNRSARLYDDTELHIADKNAVVTMNGSIEGQGDLVVGGEGQLLVNTPDFFNYDGRLVLKGGEVRLASKTVSDAGIGKATKLVLQGGKFSTVGKNEANVTYNFPIEVVAGTTSTVDFDLWNSNKCTVSGTGTLIWNVHYLREYIEGNWNAFTGQLIVNGTGSANKSQFAIKNNGIRNATIMLKGKASINGGKNAETNYLGGLSGEASTQLSGFNVKQNGNGTWVVGGANTDETFRGTIDDYAQDHSHTGKTAIVKQGTGDWRLTGNNTYSGTTTVSAGTLIVNGKHTGTGVLTVAAGATLAGKGSLAAATTINGTLLVGDTLATDRGLTFSGTLKLGAGAKLQLNDAMAEHTFYNGDELQVFTATTVSGTFQDILPATPSEGQTWDTSELYTRGVLKVVGGEEKPKDPSIDPDPQPAGETKTALLAWGNMTRTDYEGGGSNNKMVGAENDEAYGFSLALTGNLTKSYSSFGTPKFNISYKGQDLQRTAIVLSNGAQNTIFMPTGAKATKVGFWSVRTAATETTRTSFWKEVAGREYTAETAPSLIDLDAQRSAPCYVEYSLDNVADQLTFTNSGEQQAVIIYIEYHFGGPSTGITTAGARQILGTAYYTLEGKQVAQPGRGLYVVEQRTPQGIVRRKVMR
jgi:autotransporter-associated beta strand protein